MAPQSYLSSLQKNRNKIVSLPVERRDNVLFADRKSAKFKTGYCFFIPKFTSVNSGLRASCFFQPLFPKNQKNQ